MKKSYLLGMFALAAMTMVGCSNDEVVNDYSPENAIQFGTYVGRGAQSRASVITTKELGEQGFGVFAYYHKGESTPGQFSETSKPDFMYNEQVTNKGNWDATNGFDADWTYAPVKYWPNNVNDRVSFFAYAPYKADDKTDFDFELSGSDATGYPTITYTVPIVAENYVNHHNQKDLLYLKNPALHMNLNKHKVDEKITFEFGHALSRIAFAAKVLVDEVNEDPTGEKNDANHKTKKLHDGTTITINSVTLEGKFFNQGILSLYRDDENAGWSQQQALNDPIKFILKEDEFVEGENVFKGEDITTGDVKTDMNSGLLNNDENYLMIMPQDFTEENPITVTVDYNVVTEDKNLEDGKSDIHNVIESVPFKFEFKEGYAYKFVLHLGMTSVKLDVIVNDWNNGGNWVVNVPVNGDQQNTNKGEWEQYYGNGTSEGGNQGGDIEEGE